VKTDRLSTFKIVPIVKLEHLLGTINIIFHNNNGNISEVRHKKSRDLRPELLKNLLSDAKLNHFVFFLFVSDICFLILHQKEEL